MRKFRIQHKAKSNEPSREQIARYKDFASVSHRHDRITKRPKKALYRDPKLFLLLLIIGIVILLMFLE